MYSEYVLLSASKLHTLKTDLSETNRKTIEKQVKDTSSKPALMAFNIIGRVLHAFPVTCYLWNGNIFKNFCPHAPELSLAKRGFGSLTVHFVDLGDCHTRWKLPPFYIRHSVCKRGHEFFEPQLCLHSSLGFIRHSLTKVNTACDASLFILVSPVVISVESNACIERD